MFLQGAFRIAFCLLAHGSAVSDILIQKAVRFAHCAPLGMNSAFVHMQCLLIPLCAAFRRQRRLALERAQAIQRAVRVVKPQPPEVLMQLLGSCFTAQDSVYTIRQLCLGWCRLTHLHVATI